MPIYRANVFADSDSATIAIVSHSGASVVSEEVPQLTASVIRLTAGTPHASRRSAPSLTAISIFDRTLEQQPITAATGDREILYGSLAEFWKPSKNGDLEMWRPFEAGSSPVDWCEGNYSISPSIAEFMNTLSNVGFLLLPPILMHLFKDYGRFVNPWIHLIWFLLMMVGLSSAYFHATLSLMGQLLDELVILWVYMAGFCMFLPSRYFPNVFHNDRKLFSIFAILATLVATGLALIHPAINAFALMTLGIPAFGFLIAELKRTSSMRVYRLGLRCGAVWLLAVGCWVNDRLFCDTWLNLNFPYFHAFWHLFIFIASYTAAVLFAYFFVKEERPQQSAVLKYWPRDDFELGVPYVTIRSYVKMDTKTNI